MKRTSTSVDDSLVALGRSVRDWRKVHGLTAQLLADRAGITRGTLRAIETGSGAPRIENLMAVLDAMGLADVVVEALDPLATSLGRARIDRLSHERVRTPR